ncbi:hypothetical protein ACFY2N_28045 [Streptomyces rubiginosohelvolus]|uniref:hypothetical protein n=1 Tax=Streptomyces rubiginosohelvolus TaxID=67362 RepID=UPI0036799797
MAAGSVVGYVGPGAMVNGLDVGGWLAAQRDGWERLSAGQRKRPGAARRPAARETGRQGRQGRQGRRGEGAAVKAVEAVEGKARPRQAAGRAQAGAFERGVAALAQYAEREGTVVVARSWSEELPDGTVVRLGVRLSNMKTRRATLTGEQLQRLAGLGLERAKGV